MAKAADPGPKTVVSATRFLTDYELLGKESGQSLASSRMKMAKLAATIDHMASRLEQILETFEEGRRSTRY